MKMIDSLRERLPRLQKEAALPPDLLAIEARLESALTPITPRPEFVHSLQNRLRQASLSRPQQTTALARLEMDKRRNILLGTAGFLGISILILSSFRIALTLLGALGILYQTNQQLRQKKSSSVLNSF